MAWHQILAVAANILSITLSLAAIWHVRMAMKDRVKQALKDAKGILHD